MHLLLRFPAISLSALFIVLASVLVTVNPLPGFITSRMNLSSPELKPFHKSPAMLEYFYLQRSYGSPGVNVDAALWQAFDRVSASPQSALYKPFAASNTWVSEGPVNVGGRMRSVVVHPTDHKTLPWLYITHTSTGYLIGRRTCRLWASIGKTSETAVLGPAWPFRRHSPPESRPVCLALPVTSPRNCLTIRASRRQG